MSTTDRPAGLVGIDTIYLVDENDEVRRNEKDSIRRFLERFHLEETIRINDSVHYIWNLPIRSLTTKDLIITDLYPSGYWSMDPVEWDELAQLEDLAKDPGSSVVSPKAAEAQFRLGRSRPRRTFFQFVTKASDTDKDVIAASLQIAMTYLQYLARVKEFRVIVFTYVLAFAAEAEGPESAAAIQAELIKAGIHVEDIVQKTELHHTDSDFDQVTKRLEASTDQPNPSDTGG